MTTTTTFYVRYICQKITNLRLCTLWSVQRNSHKTNYVHFWIFLNYRHVNMNS